jgi:hypothetical protein
MMTQATEAVYLDGVLKPENRLELANNQRVWLIVQPIEFVLDADRKAALVRLFQGFDESTLCLTEPLPSRDELHDRR